MNGIRKFLMFIACVVAVVLLIFLIKNKWDIVAAVQNILSLFIKK